MTEQYEIILEVKPVAKGRPRFSKFGHAYTPQKTLDAEEEIRYKLISWKNKNNFKIIENKPIILEANFYFSVPKSFSKKRKEELLGKPHIIKPDCDNLMKLLCDAMNNIIYKDDCLIYNLKTGKYYSEKDLIKISIIY